MRDDELLDLLAIAFGVIATLYAYINIRKDGDGFVAVVSLCVALAAFGWVYLT